jgi:uncharacterized membrane protein
MDEKAHRPETSATDPKGAPMPIRLKKFIGTILMILLVVVYAVFATAFATLYLGESSGFVHLAYFLVTGLFWIVPAMFLIRWMEGYSPKARERR